MTVLALAPVFSFINTAAAPAGVLVVGWIATKAAKFLDIKAGSQAQDDLDQALGHGEALLIDWYKSLESHNQNVTVPDDKLTEIANRVLDLAPAAESLLGVTPDSLAPLLQAKLSQWLHWSAPAELTPLVGTSQPAPGTVINIHTPAASVSTEAAPAAPAAPAAA